MMEDYLTDIVETAETFVSMNKKKYHSDIGGPRESMPSHHGESSKDSEGKDKKWKGRSRGATRGSEGASSRHGSTKGGRKSNYALLSLSMKSPKSQWKVLTFERLLVNQTLHLQRI